MAMSDASDSPDLAPSDFSDLTPLLRQPPRRTKKAERYDRMHPVTAGMLAGAAGGELMLLTANRLIGPQQDALDLGCSLGRIVTRGALVGFEGQLAGFGAALLVGAVLGAIFAMTTRHLRRFAPLVVWSLVFFPATWTMVYALVLPRLAPWLLPMLPFVPMVAGIAVFGLFASLQLPLRTGSRPIFDVDVDGD